MVGVGWGGALFGPQQCDRLFIQGGHQGAGITHIVYERGRVCAAIHVGSLAVEGLARPIDGAELLAALCHCQHREGGQLTRYPGEIHALGTLAVGVFGMATGDPLDKLAARQPWASVNGNVLTVKLDEVPSLKSTLDSSLMGYKLFDHIGIRQLSTEQGAIRIRLGLMK